MKNLLFLGLLITGIATSTQAHTESTNPKKYVKTVKNYRIAKIVLYAAVGIGAVYSFNLWSCAALNAPAVRYPQIISPVTVAILPRLALDIATMAVCLIGLYDNLS